jgi:DNA-binding NarL/FixJ family response regulator
MNVWIVEDDAGYRRNLLMSLELDEAVTAIRAFPSCEEFFNTLAMENSPDIVLMDLGLPGMSGIEAIQKLSVEAPEVAVMVLTVFKDKKRVREAMDSGASGYLLKASDGPEIMSSLKEIVAGGSALSPVLA